MSHVFQFRKLLEATLNLRLSNCQGFGVSNCMTCDLRQNGKVCGSGRCLFATSSNILGTEGKKPTKLERTAGIKTQI